MFPHSTGLAAINNFTPRKSKYHVRENLIGSPTCRLVRAAPNSQSIHPSLHSPAPHIGCQTTHRTVGEPEARHPWAVRGGVIFRFVFFFFFANIFSASLDFSLGLGQFLVFVLQPRFFVRCLQRRISPPFSCQLYILDTALLISSMATHIALGKSLLLFESQFPRVYIPPCNSHLAGLLRG